MKIDILRLCRHHLVLTPNEGIRRLRAFPEMIRFEKFILLFFLTWRLTSAIWNCFPSNNRMKGNRPFLVFLSVITFILQLYS